jgi:hypothetical protein
MPVIWSLLILALIVSLIRAVVVHLLLMTTIVRLWNVSILPLRVCLIKLLVTAIMRPVTKLI